MAAVISSALGQTGPFISHLIEQFKMYRDSDTEKVVAATLTLGEMGALNDVSAVPGITEEVSSMFTHQHEQVRRAAAICLGCICSGNTEFFVEKVFQCIESSDASANYLASVLEIITNKPGCLDRYLDELIPLYIEQSENNDPVTLGIVSESLGRLYIHNSDRLKKALIDNLSCGDMVSNITAMKSIKYSAYKHSDSKAYAEFMPILINMVDKASDLNVQQAALEALNAIAGNGSLSTLLKKYPHLVNIALKRTP
jgi:vesicle coat complex subunit